MIDRKMQKRITVEESRGRKVEELIVLTGEQKQSWLLNSN
jgi:hypothetical protein